MKKNNLLLLLGLLFGFTACQKDDFKVSLSDVNIALKTPTGLENPTLSNVVLTFTEINTGLKTTATLDASGNLSTQLPAGSYNVLIDGDLSYSKDQETINTKIKGYKDGLIVKDGDVKFDVELFVSDDKASLILKEIYYTGSITPEGKPYNGDKYFIIYNNSADTLYADGLLIAQSKFLTTSKVDYTPNVMAEAFTAGQIIMIPGTGKDNPIAPGKQMVIANNAIDHREYNSNSLDLRDAEFEIELLSAINVDNPQVPNTISVSGAMTMHNRGFQSFVLAKIPAGKNIEDWKKDNYYDYTYLNVLGAIKADNAYKIPNVDIIDAVNLSVTESFQWILTAPSLDLGWSYCGTTNSDATRYGKSVLRKVLTTNPDGRVIYQDTNNSTKDFSPESKPSLAN